MKGPMSEPRSPSPASALSGGGLSPTDRVAAILDGLPYASELDAAARTETLGLLSEVLEERLMPFPVPSVPVWVLGGGFSLGVALVVLLAVGGGLLGLLAASVGFMLTFLVSVRAPLALLRSLCMLGPRRALARAGARGHLSPEQQRAIGALLEEVNRPSWQRRARAELIEPTGR